MKKILTLLLAIVLSIAFVVIILNGNNLMKILSVKQIADESKTLDASIEEASRLSTIDYINSENALENANKELKKNKNDYVELVNNTLEEDVKLANEIRKYNIDFLWTILGSYATENNLQLGIEVVKASAITENEYDLKFNVIGEYSDISDFIDTIETDPELEFKINNFKLVPSNDQEAKGVQSYDYLLATFNVEGIGLNLETLK